MSEQAESKREGDDRADELQPLSEAELEALLREGDDPPIPQEVHRRLLAPAQLHQEQRAEAERAVQQVRRSTRETTTARPTP